MAVDDAALWAVLSVETSGCGFLPDRRPKILFERHIFRRLTGGTFDSVAPDVSGPKTDDYGPGGAHQYERLQVARRLDEDAALKSASWGLAQIMGMNYQAAGFDNVRDMVTAMVASEDAQVKAMANFVNANAMAKALRTRDWAGFASAYNGPGFAANNYDGKLRDAFAAFSAGPMPDLRVRAVQVLLTYKGFSPQGIDGIAGRHTTDAVKAYQTSLGVPATGNIDDISLVAAFDTPPA